MTSIAQPLSASFAIYTLAILVYLFNSFIFHHLTRVSLISPTEWLTNSLLIRAIRLILFIRFVHFLPSRSSQSSVNRMIDKEATFSEHRALSLALYYPPLGFPRVSRMSSSISRHDIACDNQSDNRNDHISRDCVEPLQKKLAHLK